MASLDTAQHLRWHAGLDDAADSSVPSISSCTEAGSGEEGRLEEALADFLAGLSRFNHELNGAVPSAGRPHVGVVSTDVAYAVAEVARLLRDYADERHDPAAHRAAWLVETAWLGVVAGDIDDLEQHLKEEEWARREASDG